MPADFSEIIRLAREAKGWSKSELARRLKVERQTVGDWEAGRSAPNRKRAPLVARVLGLPLSTISDASALANVAFLDTGADTRLVPLIDWVNAGLGSEAVAPYPLGEGKDYLKISFPVSDRTFALEVRGHSMEPDFHEGDIIVIDPAVEPHNDDYVVAELLSEGQEPGTGEATFKLYKSRGGMNGHKVFDLVPANPEYETVTVNRARPGRVVGTLVEHRRRMRR